ncbi:MAG: hypothetical protein HKL85_00125 [Acidimicrobiaceae bacterium]|nr:hypothetical protein [Acidimicrobiaceae bacterium]
MNSDRRIFARAFEVNLQSLAPVTGLITAAPVMLVFALGLWLHDPLGAVSMAVGANLVAVVSLVGAPKLPLRLAVLDAVGLGISVFVGTLTSGHPWLHTIMLVPLGFAAGMAVIFGQTQAVLGSQAIVAYLVLGRFGGSALTAVHLGFLVSAGALVEVAALLVLRLPPTLRYQRSKVANALASLAQYATTPAEESAFGVLASIDDAQRVLSQMSLFGRNDDRDLGAIIVQARRARLDFTTLAGLRARLAIIDPTLLNEVHSALSAVAEGVTQLSIAVRRPSRSNTWRSSASELHRFIDDLQRRLEAGDFSDDAQTLMTLVLAHLDALGGQLRSIGNLIERESVETQRGAWRLDVRWGGLDPSHVGANIELLRDNMRRDSIAFRHAVRLVVAILIAVGLAHWLNLPRGYWVPFAVALILKPDYSTLLHRGTGRVIGTMLGASLAAVLVGELHPSYTLSTVLVGVVATLAYTTWPANFSVSIGLVTALVLILLSVTTNDSVGTALDRLLDVTLGAVIAALTYLVWPSSPTNDVRQVEASMFSALARYVDVVLSSALGTEHDAAAISEQSRIAHFRFAAAETAVGRLLEEPASTRGDPQVERGLLLSGLRILRTTHAMRFEAERGAFSTTTPALEALRHTLVHTLDQIGRGQSDLPSLSPRAAYRGAQPDFSRPDCPASMALNLDEIVNAINTASHLISQ